MKSHSTRPLAPLVRAIAQGVVPAERLATPRSQPAEFVPLANEQALDDWFAQSEEQKVVLFLHDPSCPISRSAYSQMSRLDGVIPLIDVRTGTQLSRAVEARTGVRHESPQVIVLQRGRPVWSASHFAITADAVNAALCNG